MAIDKLEVSSGEFDSERNALTAKRLGYGHVQIEVSSWTPEVFQMGRIVLTAAEVAALCELLRVE